LYLKFVTQLSPLFNALSVSRRPVHTTRSKLSARLALPQGKNSRSSHPPPTAPPVNRRHSKFLLQNLRRSVNIQASKLRLLHAFSKFRQEPRNRPSPPGALDVKMSKEIPLAKCNSNSSASCSEGTSAKRGTPFAARIFANVSRWTASPTVTSGFGPNNNPENSSSLHQLSTALSAAASPAVKISVAAWSRSDASPELSPVIAFFSVLDIVDPKIVA